MQFRLASNSLGSRGWPRFSCLSLETVGFEDGLTTFFSSCNTDDSAMALLLLQVPSLIIGKGLEAPGSREGRFPAIWLVIVELSTAPGHRPWSLAEPILQGLPVCAPPALPAPRPGSALGTPHAVASFVALYFTLTH